MSVKAGNGTITFSDGSTQGSTWIGLRGNVYTVNTTFTIPSPQLKFTLVGGGGGGGGAVSNSSTRPAIAGGGGAGGTTIIYLTNLTPNNTLTFTVGKGGLGGTSTSANGVSGQSTSISSGTQTITTITVGGGGGGSNANGFLSTISTQGISNVGQFLGTNSSYIPAYNYVSFGLPSKIGGSPTGPYTTSTSNVAGNNATSVGAGGGGAQSSGSTFFNGGNGANGIIIVEW